MRSPKASEGEGGALGEAVARERGNTVGVRDQVMDLVASQGEKVSRAEVNLMPTPMALDGSKGGLKNSEEREALGLQVHLPNVARDLLPTTSARDFKDGPAPRERDGVIQKDTLGRAMLHGGEVLLPTTRVSMAKGGEVSQRQEGNPKSRLEAVTNWGKFEPAIRRWEDTIGRPAPAPTKPDGKEGAHRLSSAFTEWMMGLPEGWITEVGLSRNAELKACGNGVVPQQAELALRFLLQGVDL